MINQFSSSQSQSQSQTGEHMTWHPISKRMILINKISRGLSQSHPEYQHKPRWKLQLLLKKVSLQTYQLERERDENLAALDVLRECAWQLLEIHQHAARTQQPIEPAQIYQLVMDMLEVLEPADGGQVTT